MSRALALARFVSEWADAVKHHATELAKGGAEIPGYKLQERRGRKDVADLAEAWTLIEGMLEQPAFLRCCSLSLPKLADAVAVAGGIPKARAEREIAEKLAPVVERRASWAWDTVTGRAKSPSGLGFYPRNPEGKTRWAAMDFDTHSGEQEDRDKARRLAMDAIHYFLHCHPQLFIALATSGGGSWHLFLFTEEMHPCDEWTLLMWQVADFLGVPIQKGSLEIFPNETRGGTGYGIRAPGTWNPKIGECGGIVFENVTPLLQKISGGSFFSGGIPLSLFFFVCFSFLFIKGRFFFLPKREKENITCLLMKLIT